MSELGVTTSGERALDVRFTEFPTRLRGKLEQRIRGLTDVLEERIRAAAPYLTGKLRGEITERVFTNQPDRVAGYVSVYGQDRNDYAKAATLEYGSDKVRRRLSKGGGIIERLTRSRHLADRVGKPAHIEAFRYLRGPFEDMRPEMEAGIAEALTETVAEGNG